MKLWLAVLACFISINTQAQSFIDPHGLEKSDKSPDYLAVTGFYKNLSRNTKTMVFRTIGPTDINEPLQVLYYSADGSFDIRKWKQEGKIVILINNGIHPGEPDGIVASMQLLWDIANEKVTIPEKIVLAVVPIFNVNGAIKQRAYSRANQNGPLVTGFRGNAQNLDLNRDFIKMDARETRSMAKLFRMLDPDILIDNHVSNGADYQHIMTLLSTQYCKLGGPMGKYLEKSFEPGLYADMRKRGYDLVPYVNVWGTTPDNGWKAFLETPRFFSGYAAMFHTYAFVAETHMLKPFEDRVKATYALMQSVIHFADDHAEHIKETRKEQRKWISKAKVLPLNWVIDTTVYKKIELKGYKSGYKPSLVSGKPRLFYDRNQPFTDSVPYYNSCIVSNSAVVPKAYIIPQGWNKVIQRLKHSGVKIEELEADTTMDVAAYYITDYKTGDHPYEGHYLHTDVRVKKVSQKMSFRKGDYYISLAQPAKRYIMETLEPTAPDAFFAWGFFDATLQQKEYYSAYVFEDEAARLLEQDSTLRAQLNEKKAADTSFANSGKAQLHFVYQHSPYHEPEHMRYPVYRLE